MSDFSKTLVQKHPLPWTSKISPITGNLTAWNDAPTILVDARGDEVKLNTNSYVFIAEMTRQLTSKQLRRLGQRPTGLFVVKNKVNGTYIDGRDITRTQHYRSRYQAQRCANRQNRNPVENWVVVELDIKEKV